MLSRAATSLTLFGRHLERADHLARILGVHVALSLDRSDEPGPEFWMRFMQLAGWAGSDTGRRVVRDHGVLQVRDVPVSERACTRTAGRYNAHRRDPEDDELRRRRMRNLRQV